LAREQGVRPSRFSDDRRALRSVFEGGLQWARQFRGSPFSQIGGRFLPANRPLAFLPSRRQSQPIARVRSSGRVRRWIGPHFVTLWCRARPRSLPGERAREFDSRCAVQREPPSLSHGLIFAIRRRFSTESRRERNRSIVRKKSCPAKWSMHASSHMVEQSAIQTGGLVIWRTPQGALISTPIAPNATGVVGPFESKLFVNKPTIKVPVNDGPITTPKVI